jgi:hypothetical protein
MSGAVLVGIVMTRDGLCQRQALAADGWSIRAESWSCSGLELRSQHGRHMPLNVGHDPSQIIGEVLALHRTHEGAVWAVASADEWIAEVDEPLYFSAECTANRSWGDIAVAAVALTTAPAMLAMRPVEVMRGRIDNGYDREGWRLEGVRREAVDAALAHLQHRRRDRRAPLIVSGEAFVEGRALSDLEGAELLQVLEDQDWDRRALGRLEWRPGTILNVR